MKTEDGLFAAFLLIGFAMVTLGVYSAINTH